MDSVAKKPQKPAKKKKKTQDKNSGQMEVEEEAPKEDSTDKSNKKEEAKFESPMIDEIKKNLHVVSDLAQYNSNSTKECKERIDAEIKEIILEDEVLRKTANKNLIQDKISIENNWKIKKYFEIQSKNYSLEGFNKEFEDWFVGIAAKAEECLYFCDQISNRDVMDVYVSTIRTGLVTIKSAVKSGLNKKFLIEYGHQCALLHQLHTPENIDELRETRVVSLCTNKPGTRKTPKHPILILKVMKSSIEEEMKIVKTYMKTLAHRFIRDEFFVILADATKAIFVRYDGYSSNICVSEEFGEDLKAEFGTDGKKGNVTKASEDLFKIIFSILNSTMEKCEMFFVSHT